jgi:hypothetical protein
MKVKAIPTNPKGEQYAGEPSLGSETFQFVTVENLSVWYPAKKNLIGKPIS